MLLENQPIRRRLITILLLTSGVVVSLTCAAFLIYQLLTLRQAHDTWRHFGASRWTVGGAVVGDFRASSDV